LIVDDNPGFLEAARTLLEQEGLQVVGVASTGAEAVQRAAELHPDVTLVGIDLIEASPALGFLGTGAIGHGDREAAPTARRRS
jgi:DNA-binding NarL/FixJ family response regulator